MFHCILRRPADVLRISDDCLPNMDKSSYVRRRNLNAPNILLNDSLVSAGGFDEKGLEPVNYL